MRHGWALLVASVLGAMALLLWLTAPAQGDFANADAPRHALNGVFVLDFLRQAPLRHPMAWAFDYYLQWPSLSIGFYPPLFYVVEALVYAVAGIGHPQAQAAVALFAWLLGVSATVLARTLLPRGTALAAALMLMAAPEIAAWERQVMLDIPMQACAVAAAAAFAHYLRGGRPRALALAAAFVLAAIYIKSTAAFLLLPFAAALFAARGWAALRDRAVLAIAGLAALAAVPAVLMTWQFGRMNAENVAGPLGAPLDSVARWTEYAGWLPAQLGWTPVLLAIPGAMLLWRNAPRPLAVLLSVWFAAGYLVFSAISIHEPRHDLLIVLPLLLCAALTVQAALRRFAAAGAAALAAGTLYLALTAAPYRLGGYAEIAAYVAAHAPPGSAVLFDGFRDGNFVYALRARDDRNDLGVLRANKLLVHYAVQREWGITEAGYDRAGLLKLLDDSGVAMVVAQRGFWTDLKQMALLEDVLHGPEFRLLASFPVQGSLVRDDGGAGEVGAPVEIFVPVVPPAHGRRPPALFLPFLGRTLQGSGGSAGP